MRVLSKNLAAVAAAAVVGAFGFLALTPADARGSGKLNAFAAKDAVTQIVNSSPIMANGKIYVGSFALGSLGILYVYGLQR